MSEDRHSFSDPRIAEGVSSGDSLSWEVDVFRKGVEGPVDTLRVNNENLPPRVNKKGKTVWRLPKDKIRLPSFGADEKRRLLELYKEHRKNRKKGNKTSSSNAGSVSSEEAPSKMSVEPPITNTISSGSNKKKKEKKKKKLSPMRVEPDLIHPSPVQPVPDEPHNALPESHYEMKEEEANQPPPGFHLPSMDTWNEDGPNEDPLPEPRLAPSSSRYIFVPERDRKSKESPSLAVAAAKAFVDLYYPHITHGLSSDLAMHYTPHAQKSVSVGGAHSVVQGRDPIALQIASLSGSVFVVRGVVSQDTVEGLGAHVLVTGIMCPQPPQNQTTTPFCHSISLVPAKENGQNIPYAFQVHNDALSLLSGDMIAAAVNPQQAPQPIANFDAPHHLFHQPVKQPPGLFG